MRTAQHETANRVQTVSGSVSALGVVQKGTGFVVHKLATGVYSIRWTFPVRQVLNVVVVPLSLGILRFSYVDSNWAPGVIAVRTYDDAMTTAVDAEFGFTATVIPQ